MDFLEKLNPAQREAATTIEGPLLVLAGAGTGKTHDMTCRVGYMINQGISPEHILMITFTNKAAREMKERLASYLGADIAEKVTACTFHSFCVLMLRKYGKAIGLNNNFTVLSTGEDEDIISMVKSVEDKQRYSGKGFPPNGKICSFISTAINKNKSISEVMKDSKYTKFVDEVIELGQKASVYKKNNSLVNYDDLLVAFVELLNTCPDIARTIAETYQYIIVDEYQDTNPLQDAILLQLFQYTKNIAVVGDDMQSLYGFRGAEVRNIIDFPKKFEGCKIVYLTQNYRSSQEILDLSNKVTECATEGFPKKLVGARHSGIKPAVVSVSDQREEAQYVMRTIRAMVQKGIPLEQICIVERNSISSAEIEVMLNKEGIPFDKYGGMKFLDFSYVKDILAYLKIMLNPYDEISWFRILQVHKGIGAVNARKIASGLKTEGFKHLLDKKYEKRIYGEELKLLHEQLVFCEGLELIKMLESFIDFYIGTNKRNIEAMDTDEGSRTQYLLENKSHGEDLRRLIDIAASYKKIDAFLDDLMLDNTTINDSATEGKLVISTVHSVKGLEYNTVIVLDCVNGLFPSAETAGTQEDNEELRCFYVAITRAKEHLFLMSPKSASRYGRPLPGVPSRYLEHTHGLLRSNDNNFYSRFYEEPVDSWQFRRGNIWR